MEAVLRFWVNVVQRGQIPEGGNVRSSRLQAPMASTSPGQLDIGSSAYPVRRAARWARCHSPEPSVPRPVVAAKLANARRAPWCNGLISRKNMAARTTEKRNGTSLTRHPAAFSKRESALCSPPILTT